MTQQDYARQINEHLGALKGIDETMLPCDKPCASHASFIAKQGHEFALISLMAQYTSNGMSTDIANKVSETLQKNYPPQAAIPVIPVKPQRNINITIPGTSKILTMTLQSLGTWSYRILLIVFLSWYTTGKIDPATIRQLIHQEITVNMNKTATTNATVTVNNPTP
jgi:hypothetical protein